MTNGLVLKQRPSLEVSKYWVEKKYPHIYVGYTDVIPDNVLLDIVRNGSPFDVTALMSNKREIPSHVLCEMLSYDYGVKANYFLFKFIRQPNLDAEVLEMLFRFYSDKPKVLLALAHNVNTPAHVLIDLLPISSIVKDAASGRGTELDYEFVACFNESTPVWDALYASQWITMKTSVNILWEKRYPELVEYLKVAQNLDVTNYPLEWVQQLVWNNDLMQ